MGGEGEKMGGGDVEEKRWEEREMSGRVVTIRGTDYCCTVAEVQEGSDKHSLGGKGEPG